MTIKLAAVERKRRRRAFENRAPAVLLLLIFGLVGLQLHSEWHGEKGGIKATLQLRLEEVLSSSNSSRTSSTHTSDTVVDCAKVRGNSGKWVQDWEYANRTHYKLQKTYTTWHLPEQNFEPTVDEPFRWATTWKWQDDSDACPVQQIAKEDFCDLIYDLDIRRFLIMGDSLSIEFGISLLSLLGHVPNHVETRFRKIQTKRFVLSCPSKVKQNETDMNTTTPTSSFTRPRFDFSISIMRRSSIQDLQAMCKVAKNESLQYTGWDYQYRKFALPEQSDKDYSRRTAIVFNTGSWIQGGLEQYKEGFHCMVDWIDSLQRHSNETNRILAFFRPTNGPNFDCLPQESFNNGTLEHPIRQSPHTNMEQYQLVAETATKNESITHLHDHVYQTADGVQYSQNWHLTEAFNDFSKQYIEERQINQPQNGPSSSAVPIHWLNTYYSTALRRDGHIGFGDCLHYALPGPTDSWVHFFYSHLLDLRKQ